MRRSDSVGPEQGDGDGATVLREGD